MQHINIELVQTLLEHVKNERHNEASVLFDEMAALKESHIVEEVENIALNLQKTMESFGNDSPILKHTKLDLPDASERLAYVVEATAEASDKTLSASENLMAILSSIESKTTDKNILALVTEANLEVTEILMAQSFQDLTGQVLNRIMMMVSSLEESLHHLILSSGIDLNSIQFETDEDKKKADEAHGVGPNVTKSSQKDALNSQQDVDDLLGDLGI